MRDIAKRVLLPSAILALLAVIFVLTFFKTPAALSLEQINELRQLKQSDYWEQREKQASDS